MTQPREIWNNQFANLLLDSMAEGVFTLNPNGTIQSWNPSMKKITGYTAIEAIGQTCRILKFSSCFNRSCPEDAREFGIFHKITMDPTECKLRNLDIRIITATHKDLFNLVEQGLFREDLYYRLKVFPIHIPPLRTRKEDIPLPTRHFINQFNQKTGKSIKDLTSDRNARGLKPDSDQTIDAKSKIR